MRSISLGGSAARECDCERAGEAPNQAEAATSAIAPIIACRKSGFERIPMTQILQALNLAADPSRQKRQARDAVFFDRNLRRKLFSIHAILARSAAICRHLDSPLLSKIG
jgi:hypothetical protein